MNAPRKQTDQAIAQHIKQHAAPSQSALDAAVVVLKSAKGPLNTKTMIERMLKRGLWQTNGKTPHATLYSAIAREIKVKADKSRFKKAARGTFELA